MHKIQMVLCYTDVCCLQVVYALMYQIICDEFFSCGRGNILVNPALNSFMCHVIFRIVQQHLFLELFNKWNEISQLMVRELIFTIVETQQYSLDWNNCCFMYR